MKYKVKRWDSGPNGRIDQELMIEADSYQRDGSTFTFYRGNAPIGTYEHVTQVELVEEK